MSEKKLIISSLIIGIIIISLSFFYKVGIESTPNNNDNQNNNHPPEIGELNSEHSHMSFVMMIEGEIYDFSDESYAERNELTHFHYGDPITIHKHAKGITLPYFLETLGMRLTSDCIILDAGDNYCEDGNNNLYMFVDGGIVSSPDSYELWHGDRILLYYGNEDFIDVRIKAQDVPEVSEELMEDSFGVSRRRN